MHVAQRIKVLQNLCRQNLDRIFTMRINSLTTRSVQKYDKMLTTRIAKPVQNDDYTKFRIVTEADDYTRFNIYIFTKNILA